MRFYMYVQDKVVGPYTPEDVSGLFGGVAPETLICKEFECERGRLEWHKIGLFPELSACVKKEITEPLRGGRPLTLFNNRLKILSTDDDASIRSLLWYMLSDAGHSVEFARDGEEVFKRLSAKNYDLVILDVNMPKMNGYKVSRILHDKLPRPPRVIIFTGRNLEEERLQYVCSGADAILNKDAGNDRLLETINSLFSENSRAKGPVKAEFVPEPRPASLEGFSLPGGPVAPAGDGFFSAVPGADMLEIEHSPLPAAAAPAHINPVSGQVVEKSGPPPVPGLEKTGSPAPASSFPVEEKKSSQPPPVADYSALKTDIVEIKRRLELVEIQYARLGSQIAQDQLKISEDAKILAGSVKGEFSSFRRLIALLTILFGVLIAALLLLPG